jgi:hypothetical protein
MQTIDRVVADLRVHEARQAAILTLADKRADYISAEVLKSEFHCQPQDIGDFLEGDEDFLSELCVAVALIVKDPRNLSNLHRVINAFDHAVERQAAKEFDEWRAA